MDGGRKQISTKELQGFTEQTLYAFRSPPFDQELVTFPARSQAVQQRLQYLSMAMTKVQALEYETDIN